MLRLVMYYPLVANDTKMYELAWYVCASNAFSHFFCACVYQTLMNVLKDLFSVTAVLTALTYQAGTIVNAEMATMTMGCSPWVESHVKVSIRNQRV